MLLSMIIVNLNSIQFSTLCCEQSLNYYASISQFLFTNAFPLA